MGNLVGGHVALMAVARRARCANGSALLDPIPSDGDVKRRCFFRPRGTASAVALAQLIADALFDACQGGMDDALVDIRAVNGFESPGPLFRAWAVGLWARMAGEDLRVAMVARPEHICPHKTGLLVAAEEGLQANIFDSEAPALAWLNSFRTPP